MSQLIASSYLILNLALVTPATHHVLEEAADTRLRRPAMPSSSLQAPRDTHYGVLDHLIFLLPTHNGRGPSTFVRGVSGQSGQDLGR